VLLPRNSLIARTREATFRSLTDEDEVDADGQASPGGKVLVVGPAGVALLGQREEVHFLLLHDLGVRVLWKTCALCSPVKRQNGEKNGRETPAESQNLNEEREREQRREKEAPPSALLSFPILVAK